MRRGTLHALPSRTQQRLDVDLAQRLKPEAIYPMPLLGFGDRWLSGHPTYANGHFRPTLESVRLHARGAWDRVVSGAELLLTPSWSESAHHPFGPGGIGRTSAMTHLLGHHNGASVAIRCAVRHTGEELPDTSPVTAYASPMPSESSRCNTCRHCCRLPCLTRSE